MPNRNLRIEKGSQAPSETGEGSTYFIPADDMPDGATSGAKVKLIIEGTLNVDDQGGSIKADKIYIENLEEDEKRTDDLQDSLEAGLKIEMNIGK